MMDILVLFVNFIDQIFSFKIFDIDIFTYLITITIVILVVTFVNAFKNK